MSNPHLCGDFLIEAQDLLCDAKWVAKRLRRLGDLPMPQEDVVQSAYAKLHRRIMSGKPLKVESPKSYVATVLRNVVRDALRKKIRKEKRLSVTFLEVPVADATQAQPIDLLTAEETLDILRQRLPQAVRSILEEVLQGGERPDRRQVYQMRQAVLRILDIEAA